MSASPSVRVYGYGTGESSFAQVTRGLLGVLRGMGELAGFYPIDGDPESQPEELRGGESAPLSLNIGSPDGILRAHRYGGHRKHWLLLAPNSETISHGFVEGITKRSDVLPEGLLTGGFLTPSTWGKNVIERAFPDRQIIVAPHGVTEEVHTPSYAMLAATAHEYSLGLFNVLHLSSTESDRKSTRRLMEAWKRLKTGRSLPETAKLYILMNPTEVSRLRWWAADIGLKTEDVEIEPGLVHNQRSIAALYSTMHVVCQPSRAEGFGMVPLEALCMGVPVVATASTGHAEFASTGLPGLVVVPHGPSAPIDDFPGATAPTVSVEAIASMLQYAYVRWLSLAEAARQNAPALASEWSWQKKNERPLKKMIATETGEST